MNVVGDVVETFDLAHDFTIRTLVHVGLRAGEFSQLWSDWMDWQNEPLRVPAEQDGWTPKTEHAAGTIPVREPDTLRVIREFFKRNEAVGVGRQTVSHRVRHGAEEKLHCELPD